MSDKTKIYAAFVKAQKEFAPALKTTENPHFKKKYADLSACVEAVIDALNNHGIGLIQRPVPDERGVTVETIFIHESGEEMHGGSMSVPAARQDPQGYGSAATYARRYGLMAACGIAPEDDDGNAASAKQAQPARPARQSVAKPAQEAPQGPETDASIIATHVSAMEACTSLDSLKATFKQAWIETRGAPAIKGSYEHFKAELAKPAAEQAA